ncbi:MAG TPA: hypothetical protein VGH63_15335 [Polyangia bacterium]|jgi:hypothetical protein
MKRSSFSTGILSLASILPLTFAACGGGTDSGDCTASGGTNKAQYVTNAVMVPQQRKDYAIDLNGDGVLDNQLGNIIGALTGQGLDVQMGVDQAVTDGSLIVLLGESSTDAAFQTDACATTTVNVGQSIVAPALPDYSGSGHFTIDSTNPGGTFNGPIKVGKFSSAPPATTTTPVSVTIKLPLVAGADPVKLEVDGAHLQFTRDSSGKITGGQLNGAIKQTAVQMDIIPNVATLLSNKLMNDMPQTPTDMQIASIFDNGGKADAACSTGTCKNPGYGTRAGMCAAAKDNIIDTCEVSTAGLIQNVLASDVQMFDASGKYAPNKANTTKDSLSLGLSFSAVGASF